MSRGIIISNVGETNQDYSFHSWLLSTTPPLVMMPLYTPWNVWTQHWTEGGPPTFPALGKIGESWENIHLSSLQFAAAPMQCLLNTSSYHFVGDDSNSMLDVCCTSHHSAAIRAMVQYCHISINISITISCQHQHMTLSFAICPLQMCMLQAQVSHWRTGHIGSLLDCPNTGCVTLLAANPQQATGPTHQGNF